MIQSFLLIFGYILLFWGLVKLTVWAFSSDNDHYFNDKGQRILKPKDYRGKRFYKGECDAEKHQLPMYNNGVSISVGSPDEPCQCGLTTVGREMYKSLRGV